MLVYIGIPVIDGKPCAQTVDSLLAEQLLGFGQGVHFLVDWEIGCSLIGAARNRIAKRFIETKAAACLVFVDADIAWKGGALAQLAARPEPVIGGTYRAKREDVLFHIHGEPVPVGDLYRVDGLPGGFLKIGREAFERIPADSYSVEDGSVMRDYFPTGFHEGRFYGEDYGFCRLWRSAGGDVWLDPDILLRHHDGLRQYAGSPRQWLESRA